MLLLKLSRRFLISHPWAELGGWVTVPLGVEKSDIKNRLNSFKSMMDVKFEVSAMLSLGCRWVCPEKGGIIINYEESCNRSFSFELYPSKVAE